MSNVPGARTSSPTLPALLYIWNPASVPQALIVRKSIGTAAKWTAITSSQIAWLNITLSARTSTNPRLPPALLGTRVEDVTHAIFAPLALPICQLSINTLTALSTSRKSIIAPVASLNSSPWAHWSTIWRAKRVERSGPILWLDRWLPLLTGFWSLIDGLKKAIWRLVHQYMTRSQRWSDCYSSGALLWQILKYVIILF